MVQPRLIHPVPIIIQRLDKSNTFYDDDYREPVQQSARYTNITIQGQPRWGGKDVATFTRGGLVEQSTGYVLFRYLDLEAASITINVNDRFIKIGLQEVDVYVVRLIPQGHYNGRAKLVKAYFADRQPARQRIGV